MVAWARRCVCGQGLIIIDGQWSHLGQCGASITRHVERCRFGMEDARQFVMEDTSNDVMCRSNLL